MQSRNRFIARTLSVALSILLLSTACDSKHDKTNAGSSNTAGSKICVDDTLADYQNTGTQTEGLKYLNDPERVKRLKSLTSRAGKLIAMKLMSGEFGPTEKYNDYKNDLTSDYVGPGGIQSRDKAISAWVQWDHGKIDYSTPITQVSIEHKSASTPTQVSITAATSKSRPWELVLAFTAQCSIVTTATFLPTESSLAAQTFKPTEDDHFLYPSSLSRLIIADADALNQFDKNMNSWFPEWKE